MKYHHGQTWRLWIVAIAITLLFAAFQSLAFAEFTGDDWHYFALLKHIDSPLDIFSSNLGGTYFYRPVVLFLFWLSEWIFADHALAQYGINVAIHCWVAFEIAALSLVITARRNAATCCALLFLVFPAAAATPLWVSNRFDLLATAAMLGALRCMTLWATSSSAKRRYLWLSFAATAVAIGSKETAFALLPALLLLILLLNRERESRLRVYAVGALVAIGVLALLARTHALNGWQGDQSLTITTQSIVLGAASWAQNFPHALQTNHGLVALAVFVVGAVGAWLYGPRLERSARAVPIKRFTLVMAVLLLAVVCAQAPIATTALPADGSAMATVSLRFFYTATALLFVVGAAILSRLESVGVSRRLLWTATSTAVVICALGTHTQTHTWAQQTSGEKQRAGGPLAAYASIAESLKSERLCLVELTPTATIADLDLRFKTSLKRGDSRVNCVLLSAPPQSQTITRIKDCQASSTLPARSVMVGLQPMQRSGTCTFFFLEK